MKNCDNFLEEHKIKPENVDFQQIVDLFMNDMLNGLEGKPGSLRMIPTYIEAENQFLKGVPVVAIDAGGTNFRAALVRFNKQGKLEISNQVNAKMPGQEGEISKDEFFSTIAGYIKSNAELSDRIGFCFSYPTEILPNRDGKLLQFCKEVQAPEVVGQLIGKNLLDTLGMEEKQIVLLNDTVATLLAGKSAAMDRDYDSYIGFILGTGTNTCYIESNKNILKLKNIDKARSQIINIESGNFGKVPQTDLDKMFDKTTNNPEDYKFEKMFAGGYFGGLCLTVFKSAARDGVFSAATAKDILAIKELTSEDVDNYISNTNIGCSPLYECNIKDADHENLIKIIDCLLNRAAKLVAANIASVILKTGKGKSAEKPVLITTEGTTFHKMHNLKSYFENYLRDYLKDDRKRFYEFTTVKHSSLVGAALAALIN
jgi:hexokinase